MVITEREIHFMQMAIAESRYGMEHDFGGPFGCIVVKENKIIAKGFNRVSSSNDPTAHAEVVAIRAACIALNTFQLTGCEIYTSCEPCPMCLGAIYWARPDIVYYANTKKDAADIGFDDQFIYDELAVPMDERKLPIVPVHIPEAIKVFDDWTSKQDKIAY